MEQHFIADNSKELSLELSGFLLWVNKNTYMLDGEYCWENNRYGVQYNVVTIGELADTFIEMKNNPSKFLK